MSKHANDGARAKTTIDFYQRVYARDNPEGESHGWVQWKGTNVCMDVHCLCGESSHIDADFAYFVRCGKCGKRYAVGQNVALIPLTDVDADYAATRTGFVTSEP